MNIVLIGYRGAGKTTVGKCLANRLWMDFVDTDALIVQRAGKSIREIFDAEGEAGFRRRESEVIAEMAQRDNQVIAAGGGAILDAGNVAALKKNGRIIWLEARAETLMERIGADATTADLRPNLTSAGGIEEIRQVLSQRAALYKAAADVTLDVNHLTPQEAAVRLVSLI